jgi:hypothetical protein
MCFLPNRRASIDQAPGPIIANAAARTACAIVTDGSRECDENSEIAIPHFSSSRQYPSQRREPPTYCGRNTDYLRSDRRWRRFTDAADSECDQRCAVSKRRRRRPAPGHPSANVENNRCTISIKRIEDLRRNRQVRKWDDAIPILGDQSWMIPRFSAVVTA